MGDGAIRSVEAEPQLVGRERELAALRALFERRPGPCMVVLTGGPGIGKTTLWEAGIAAARDRGFLELSARASFAEGDVSFAALTDLLDRVELGSVESLPAPQRRALEVALLRVEPGGQAPSSRAIARRLPTDGRSAWRRAADGTSTTSVRTIRTPALRRLDARVRVRFVAGATSTTFTQLTIFHVPAGAKVLVICHGGGCPFGRRAFPVRHGTASATAALRHSPLRPGAKLEVEITATGSIGETETFRIHSGRPPTETAGCLAVGGGRPVRCQ